MRGPRLKPIGEQTIVITGASSGIGLATARRAAAAGARVVLVARNGDALAEIVDDIGRSGAEATAVPGDVADRDSLARGLEAELGGDAAVDTWVNDAGVDLWGRLVDTDDADHRRLFETNYWGVVNGSLLAVQALGEGGGALINVGSVESDRAFPLQGAYAASKHAVKGFTDALRMELEHQELPISVTLVKPGSIGTPLPDHAKTYLDRAPRLPQPVYDPDEVARAIIDAAQRPVRDVYVGGQARLMAVLAAFPRVLDRLSERSFIDAQLSDRPAAGRVDNLHRPGRGGRVHGTDVGRLKRSTYTRLARHRVTTGAALTAAGATAVALLYGKRLRRR